MKFLSQTAALNNSSAAPSQEQENYENLSREDLIAKLEHYKKLAKRNLEIQPSRNSFFQ
jgi:hypothetical protein